MARILHVEDDPSWQRSVRRIFSDYQIDSADSYQDAVKLVQGHRYDVALVDLHLKDRHDQLGLELLDMLLSFAPQMRRILITGDPPSGSLMDILKDYSIEDILAKGPTDQTKMRGAVDRALAKGPVVVFDEASRAALQQRIQGAIRERTNALLEKRRHWERYAEESDKVRRGQGRIAERYVEWIDKRLAETQTFFAEVKQRVADCRSTRDALEIIDLLQEFRREVIIEEPDLDDDDDQHP